MTNLKRIMITLAVLLTTIGSVMAADIYESLQILPGLLEPVDGSTSLPIVGFADVDADAGAVSQTVLFMVLGDRLHLTITNNDNRLHGVQWVNSDAITDIPIGTNGTMIFEPETSGAYLFFDGHEYPFNVARGLSGVVIVKEPVDTNQDYVWFLNEHDTEWLTALANGQSVDSSTYLADYFTINGRSFPDTAEDSTATVVGTVNQPINIWIVNGGLQSHSIHFHGYHVDLLSANGEPYPSDYVKDTFPVKPGQALHTRLTAHQAGIFPVHDHSLSAVTAMGFYPSGMLTLLMIEEEGN